MDLIEIKVLHAAVERRINQEMAVINLTFVQAMVIQHLYHHKAEVICQKDIQRALGLTHPTVSSILDRLVERNLIRTQTLGEDKRYKAIYLTEQGDSLYKDIDRIIAGLSQMLFEGITSQEQTAVSHIFAKMLSNLSA